MSNIDWTNKSAKVSRYFNVHELTYLSSIKTYYMPNDQEKESLIKLAQTMDLVRELLNHPIKVSCCIRPNNIVINGQTVDYNKLVGGSPGSSHITGEAIDFTCSSYTIDEIMDAIEPYCTIHQFALENNGSIDRIKVAGGMGGPRNWVHLQTRPLKSGLPFRLFNP